MGFAHSNYVSPSATPGDSSQQQKQKSSLYAAVVAAVKTACFLRHGSIDTGEEIASNIMSNELGEVSNV